MNDFDFGGTSEQAIRDEFEDYRNAIDRLFASGMLD
jgi:hypothetical protein